MQTLSQCKPRSDLTENTACRHPVNMKITLKKKQQKEKVRKYEKDGDHEPYMNYHWQHLTERTLMHRNMNKRATEI